MHPLFRVRSVPTTDSGVCAASPCTGTHEAWEDTGHGNGALPGQYTCVLLDFLNATSKDLILIFSNLLK